MVCTGRLHELLRAGYPFQTDVRDVLLDDPDLLFGDHLHHKFGVLHIQVFPEDHADRIVERRGVTVQVEELGVVYVAAVGAFLYYPELLRDVHEPPFQMRGVLYGETGEGLHRPGFYG